MKTWYSGIPRLAHAHWDEATVYVFTVVCVFLGDYILHGARPQVGWLPFVASLVVAVLVCLAVETMQGSADTPEKKIAKKKGFPRRVLFSGVAGLASQAVVPVLVKSLMASIGVQL